MTEPAPSDETLLARTASGDDEAFVALYRRRHRGVYRFALHMCGSAAPAEDVTQEVFLALFRQAAQFDASRGTVETYVFGIARYQVRRAIAARYEHDLAADPLTDDVVIDERTDTPLQYVTRQQSVAAVRRAIATLPLHYREVVVLCELEELEYAQAAEALGQPIGTVRSRLHRARRLLARKLAEPWASLEPRAALSLARESS